jgi:hypothetical protein
MISRTAALALAYGLAASMAPAAAAQEAPAQSLSKGLSLQQAGALKCSAAFALGAAQQAQKAHGGASQWPALAVRGREFLVRTSAKVMDETGMTRDQVAAELTAQARALAADPAALATAMPPCLALLDAAGI